MEKLYHSVYKFCRPRDAHQPTTLQRILFHANRLVYLLLHLYFKAHPGLLVDVWVL